MGKETYSDYYLNDQLNIDKTLIKFRYESIKKYFKGNRCLEMGPADGVMTQYLVSDFEKLDIVDGDDVLLNTIPDYGNISKYHSWFEDFEPVEKYDTIIMEHVLEHIEYPIDVLNKVKNWLAKEGVLIAGVPNAKSFHRLAAVRMGLLDSEYSLNSRDLTQGHYRVYDLDLFKTEFIEAGYEILDEGGVFLKFLSNKQIEDHLSIDAIDAYFELGKEFQQNAADIFVIAKKKQ